MVKPEASGGKMVFPGPTPTDLHPTNTISLPLSTAQIIFYLHNFFEAIYVHALPFYRLT